MFRQWLHNLLSESHPGHLFDVLVPPDPVMGDYSVNLAFVLAKKEKKNPRDVAQELCELLSSKGQDMIEKCEVAGPGFVNVFLKDSYLQGRMGKTDISKEGDGKKIVVEYSSPNIAKPMHIGHLRSTIIGDALANVYEALGYNVIRWNFIGDWGTQFGKLIAAFKMWDTLPTDTIDDLLHIYVKFHEAMKSDPELEKRGQEEFAKLEAGDEENRKTWERIRQTSLKEFDAMYQKLGIGSFDVTKGESDYEDDLKPLTEELIQSGVAKESEGALIIDLTDEGLPPALLRKSDGATLYLTRDLASLKDRITSYHAGKILYVVANQQSLHFEQLFAVKDKLRLGSTETVHVKFGMVLGEDGKKLATREGKVIPLQQVIDEATKHATDVVRAKNADLADEQVTQIAYVVAIGALKYNDLRQHPYSDIVFDWNSMLDLGGNSGPYIQYTYARLANIIAKAGDVGDADASKLVHPSERGLMRHLLDYGYAVSQCAKLYTLNGLALYLYELAEKSNRFYEQVHINDDEDASRKAARIQLVVAVSRVLKEGLALLGIQTLERI